PTLFGDWTVLREWGRRGSPGTMRLDMISTAPTPLQPSGAVSGGGCGEVIGSRRRRRGDRRARRRAVGRTDSGSILLPCSGSVLVHGVDPDFLIAPLPPALTIIAFFARGRGPAIPVEVQRAAPRGSRGPPL